MVAEQLRQIGTRPAGIILEPLGRNTAPALTFAALALHPAHDALMLVMPADHVIQDTAAFLQAVRVGVSLAQAGRIVTFGIKPRRPDTGYGYIKKGEDNGIAAFVEKPDVETAEKYLAAGDYFWNSGIFLMRPEVWLEELGRHRPDMLEACRKMHEGGGKDQDFFRLSRDLAQRCPADSIDYTVMEKTTRGAVVPVECGWSDVGAWSAFWDICPCDARGNVAQGDVLAEDSDNSLIVAQHRFVAALGLKDTMVIETADAVLVAARDQAQNVKAIVAKLKAAAREEYRQHRKVYRPWGSYEGIDAGERFQVKRIIVHPGAAISLQMHHHRAEHWIIVRGTARITRGDEIFLLSENQSTYIPIGTKHRLENPGTIPLEMIEVQSGSYLGEDDIVRFEDNYNRHK